MMKLVLPALAVFLGLMVPLVAQTPRVSDGLAPLPLEAGDNAVFAGTDVALGRAWPGLPALALTEGERFFYPVSFGWMEEPAEFLPAFTPVAPQRVRRPRAQPTLAYADDSSAVLEEESSRFYTGGEVGFVYGRYAGKVSGAIKHGYFLSEIGNDKFHLTVGASFTEDEGRRRVRRR